MPSRVALARRRRDSEDGQVGVSEVLLARPGGQGDNDSTEMAAAGLGAPMDLGVLGVQVDLEAGRAIAGSVGLAGTRAHARQDAKHDDPSCALIREVNALR